MDVVKAIGVGLGAMVVVLVITFGLSLLLAYPIKWLWNEVCPGVFGLPVVTLWQAWCLSFLSGMMFRGPSPLRKEK